MSFPLPSENPNKINQDEKETPQKQEQQQSEQQQQKSPFPSSLSKKISDYKRLTNELLSISKDLEEANTPSTPTPTPTPTPTTILVSSAPISPTSEKNSNHSKNFLEMQTGIHKIERNGNIQEGIQLLNKSIKNECFTIKKLCMKNMMKRSSDGCSISSGNRNSGETKSLDYRYLSRRMTDIEKENQELSSEKFGDDEGCNSDTDRCSSVSSNPVGSTVRSNPTTPRRPSWTTMYEQATKATGFISEPKPQPPVSSSSSVHTVHVPSASESEVDTTRRHLFTPISLHINTETDSTATALTKTTTTIQALSSPVTIPPLVAITTITKHAIPTFTTCTVQPAEESELNPAVENTAIQDNMDIKNDRAMDTKIVALHKEDDSCNKKDESPAVKEKEEEEEEEKVDASTKEKDLVIATEDKSDDSVATTTENTNGTEIASRNRLNTNPPTRENKSEETEPQKPPEDPNPKRITNPLLELPPFPTPTSNQSEIPNAAEIWNILELYFCPSDTYTLDYYIRLLGMEIDPGFIEGNDLPLALKKSGKCITDIVTWKKEDPFFKIPKFGQFYKSLLQKHTLLDYVDPTWSLLSSQTYFPSEKLTSFVPSSLEPDASPFIFDQDCIPYATKEIRILDIDIHFRCATPEDQSMLQPHFPTFPIRALEKEGHLAILAIQNTVPIGYIHYSLSWINLSPAAEEELIFSIWDLSTCSTPTTNLALISLALEHIKRENVSYGLFQTDSIIHQELYYRYFRMEYQQDRTKDAFVICCDLSRYSYKYAMLSWKEHRDLPNEGDEEQTLEEDKKSQRVLIKMPPLEDCQEYFNVSLLQPDISSSTRKKRMSYSSSAMNKSTCSNSSMKRVYLSNPSTQPRKKLKMQLHLKPNTYLNCEKVANDDTVIFKRFHVTENKELLEDDKRILDGATVTSMEELGKLPQWKLIKRFPMPNKDVKPPPIKTNLILQDLTTKLNTLKKLEESLQPKLLNFLTEIYNDKVNYHSLSATAERQSIQNKLKECNAVLERQRDADLAWKTQLEQDMDAVCDVCGDGEVTPENQILFCERCNVAIHQRCYMIENVPEGDYFCKVCRFLEDEKEDKKEKETSMTKPLPVCCQLCPRKQGAFVRTDTSSPNPHNHKPLAKFNKNNSMLLSKNSQWVHVVCAKWQGLNYTDSTFEIIENVQTLKNHFLEQKIKCCLCKGMRGAYNKCREKNCDKFMHVTCARSSGLCTVTHGENSSGVIQSDDAWLLLCPEHFKISSKNTSTNTPGHLTLDQLEMAAKAFPPEKKQPSYKLKSFNKLSRKERELFFQDPECEAEFLPILKDRLEGARCEVCYSRDDLDMKDAPTDNTDQHVSSSSAVSSAVGQEIITTDHITTRGRAAKPRPTVFNTLTRCTVCHIVIHNDCYLNRDPTDAKAKHPKHSTTATSKKDFVCDACQYVQEYDDEETPLEIPSCHMCNQKGGALKKAFATPTSMKKWTNNHNAFKKSLFGKQIWSHAVCGMWHPTCIMANNKFNCTGVIMSNGKGHIHSNWVCCLCGGRHKVKLACAGGKDGICQAINEITPNRPFRFHLSCARQAGFEAHDSTESGENENEVSFHVKCYQHKSNMHAIRARLEDFIELEKQRVGLEFEEIDTTFMSIAHAARLMHWAVSILQIFGWAWRWTEWWVEVGDTWEPLLEEGQNEEHMTKEQLRIVDSTRESRCEDARRCRLAPFAAALRNRDYDAEKGGGRKEMHNAFRAVFHTPSLVGPLKQFEIDFFVDWLGRAYRSKSPLLGFGDDKIPCVPFGGCVHISDGSLKYELGNRPLPGKHVKDGGVFEDIGMEEPDDFLRTRWNTADVPPPAESSPNIIEAPSSIPTKPSSNISSKKKRKENEIITSSIPAGITSDTDRKTRKARAANANNNLYVDAFIDDDDQPLKVTLALK